MIDKGVKRMTQDLTLPLEEGKLNIRVAIWIEHEENILVSEFPNDLITLPGGRIKFDEASNEAAIRELYEETGEQLMDMKLFAIIENFFVQGHAYHEILYVYRGTIPFKEAYVGIDFDSQKLYWLPKTEIHQLKPQAFAQLLDKQEDIGVVHIVNRD